MIKLLNNKNVLVTGGSRGLGQAFCRECARQGANVAFNYSKDTSSAQETVAIIEEYGQKALSYQASVLNPDALDHMVQDIEKSWGSIDVLINNAGKSQPLPIALMEEEDWDDVVNLNIKGSFLAAHSVIRGMIRRKKGTILNIGSLAGLRLLEAPVHYSTSKAGIKGFTESLSKEIARYNIRVNCLAPGLLVGGVASNLPQHKEVDYLKHVALHRRGTMEEVAKFGAFMASDRNSYMNGATVIMDGGF